MNLILPIAASMIGLLIAWVDSRPGWDDTGISAAAVFACSGLLASMDPDRPWVYALAIGIWIPMLAIATTQNYSSLLAMVIAFVGAYGGMLVRKAVSPMSANT